MSSLISFLVLWLLAVGIITVAVFVLARSKHMHRIPLVCMLALSVLVMVAMLWEVHAMVGRELRPYNYLVVNQPYRVIDEPIRLPDGSFVYAIGDRSGDIAFYKLGDIVPNRSFVKRFNGATHTTWLEAN